MVKEMPSLPPSVKLLTLINVAQARPKKRKGTETVERDWYAIAKRANTSQGNAAAKGGAKKEKKEALQQDVELEKEVEEEEEDDDESELLALFFCVFFGSRAETPLFSSF